MSYVILFFLFLIFFFKLLYIMLSAAHPEGKMLQLVAKVQRILQLSAFFEEKLYFLPSESIFPSIFLHSCTQYQQEARHKKCFERRPYNSKALGSIKKSINPIVKIPYSSLQGLISSFTTMIFLKESLILSSKAISCFRLSSSGSAKADWIEFSLYLHHCILCILRSFFGNIATFCTQIYLSPTTKTDIPFYFLITASIVNIIRTFENTWR